MGGAEAEMMDKGGAAKEPKPEINNFGSTTLIFQYKVYMEKI